MVAASLRRGHGPHCQPIEVRFWTKVKADTTNPDGCWLWTGGTDGKGYASIWQNGKARQSSRVAWELRNGKPFPPDLYACHRCDNPLCVRPDHIFPGTATENMQDAIRKGRHPNMRDELHCNRGHEMVGDNVIHEVRNGRRRCRACRNLTANLRNARKRIAP